ncbi:ABC transporter permease [Cohnella panacarvi]|uniref:ABC transporter permease n=1 Tax=Cohnella panacarvi TaxID=400776 RepID=UPI000478E57E|nr:ABC transporter permease [Cohnella panacarvi]
MANFVKLVQNENMKIYRRVGTWVMLGILILLPILVSTLLYFAGQDDGSKVTGFEMMQVDAIFAFMLVTIFSVIIASGSVASEFSWGTIKLLLIRPWSRTSILLSKFIALVLFLLLTSIIAYLTCFFVNLAFFGATNAVDEVIPELNAGAGVMFRELGEFVWTEFVATLVIASFSFMLSAALRSNGLAIGLSLAIVFLSDAFASLFLMIDQPWIKFVLFLNLDLMQFMNGHTGPIDDDPMSLGFAVGVLAAYFVIFNAISLLVFRKRDVAA